MEELRLPDGAYRGALTDEHISAIFSGAGDFNRRELRVGTHIIYVYAIDGLTSGGDISELVVKPLLQDTRAGTMEELYDRALRSTVYNSVASACEDLNDAATKLVNGFTVVLFGQQAIAFETKTGEKRAPAAPEVENTVKGPKDAFTETVRTNTSLLRRHLRTPALRLYETQVGRRSLTNVTVAWIDGLTDPELVERMKKRLSEIDVDGLTTPAAVEEYVTGSRPTAFPLMQYTERTDRFAQGLLDGRVGLLVDGLPLGYLAPVDIGALMTAPEDRGTDYLSASFLRLLRYLALLIGLVLPGLYVAMATFHPEMLPTALLQAIIESKHTVPFPTVFEVLGLLVAFELLQEASISMPHSVGQSLSIIGGLVVGTAAVEAKILSPAALIVVAAAGIAGFALPGRSFADALRLWRLFLTVLASLAGLFGLTLGALCLLVHLSGLTSLDVEYLAPFSRVSGSRAIVRQRLFRQKYRDPALHPLDGKNQR
ncbi:MAG: spore germination protein [Oscillospiraceae bacterium]|nr:spore germination protein [Oscillospiraceae bacterium]